MKLEKIACVEDDPDIRMILEMSLNEIGGFQVALYEDGPTALSALASDTPQLIMLDMMMPGMNGLEVLKALRQRPAYARTPVIFMTAKAQSHELSTYISAGAQSVIVKPFDPMTLPEDIRKIWEDIDLKA